jgi:outer membrane protein TolC
LVSSLKSLLKGLPRFVPALVFAAGLYAQTPPAVPLPTPVPLPTVLPNSERQIAVTDAIDLALKQASNFKAAQLNERIAREDIRQARAAFYPKVEVQPNFIYTSPSFRKTVPREPSFISADAIAVYQGLITASGEIDTSGRLRAALKRSQALLEAASAGTEVARRDLIQSVVDAYYNLALATTQRRGSETNLAAAQDFENNTRLNLEAGEVAPVDLVRARLQTATRIDELEQARATETVNAETLDFLIGHTVTEPVEAVDLLTQMPGDNEIERYSEATISTRPEFAQFEAERRAAEMEAFAARAERRPQLTYSVSGGFISDSVLPGPLRDHTGVQANIGVSIPLFNAGASRSHEAQARLRMQQAENSRVLAERQFVQDFYIARTQAISARERIRRIGASIVDAEQNVSASLARYRAGEAPITEVVDAQNQLVTQRQLLYKAIFDYQTAKSHLLRAAGQ